MNGPKVSVVIPNYNHARYLDQRVQSVLNQSYQDFEVLYLDDASTDQSNAVFAQYAADSRVRAIVNLTNSGSPFKQWNKGVREARGEYVWIAESDDFADERLLSALVEALDAHPAAALAYCQSYLVDADGAVTGTCEAWTRHLDADRWKQNFVNSGRQECLNYMIFGATVPNASAVLFRRDIYVQAGHADETMRVCGDWLLWSKMLLRGDVVFLADPLNYFRKHPHSASQAGFKQGLLLQEQYQLIEYLARQTHPSPEALHRLCEGMLSTWLYCLRSTKLATSWSQNLNIYRRAVRVDRALGRRLVDRVMRSLVRRGRRALPQP